MVDLPVLAPPPPALSLKDRVRAGLDMWLVDHGFIRDVYCNLHRIDERAWRSAQPAPHHLRRAQRLGIRTVVNLRGRRDDCGSYILERAACHELGLTLVDFPIRSRGALEKPTLRAAAELFPRLAYPVLFHCKSGADRAGMMATLYLHLQGGVPVRRAMRHLSLRYGHVRQARTGVIDYFFERYLAEGGADGRALLDWVESAYDPKELNASFRESGWARILVNGILRRE